MSDYPTPDSILANTQQAPVQTTPETAQNAPGSAQTTGGQPTPQNWSPDALAFDFKGQKIVPDLDKAKQWIQMGYNYPQKAAELNQKEQAWQQKVSEYEQTINKWKPLEDFAAQNPGWWDHVNQNWQNRGNFQLQGLDQADPLVKEVINLKNLVGQQANIINEFKQGMDEQQKRAADAALAGEVQELQKIYPDINFSAFDVNGNSLEKQVIEHAMRNGIRSFKTAFNDYCHDMLIKRAEFKAKEEVGKTLQQKQQQGIIGETPTSQTPANVPTNLAGMNYNQITESLIKGFNLT